MKFFNLLFLLIPTLSYGLTIDEAGTQRVRKPSVTISYEVENSQGLQGAMVRLMNQALSDASSEVIIEADLDGDGELEPYKTSPTKPDTDGDGISTSLPLGWEMGRKETDADSASIKSCCSGMATGRRQYEPRNSLSQGQISLESTDGMVKFSSVRERAQVRRNRIQVNYLEFSFAYYNPKEVILDRVRKGWDGTIKGSTKPASNVNLKLVSGDGKVLSEISLKTKGSGKTEVCGSDKLCGKTDHL